MSVHTECGWEVEERMVTFYDMNGYGDNTTLIQAYWCPHCEEYVSEEDTED